MNENDLENQYKNMICIDAIVGSFGWMSHDGDYSISKVKNIDIDRGLIYAFIDAIKINGFLYNYDVRSNEQILLKSIFETSKTGPYNTKIKNMDLIIDLKNIIGNRHNNIQILNTPFNALDVQIKLRNLLKE